MNKKRMNRITGIFIILTVLSITLMLAGNLRRTSHITLAAPEDHISEGATQGADSTVNALTRVEITPETVQTAIATLARPETYCRTATVELLWENGSQAYEVRTAVSGAWSRMDRALKNQPARHVITDGETTYVWYGDERKVYIVPSGDISPDNEQTIPTYEDVLAMEQNQIAQADYRVISGLSCIYVETEEDEQGYIHRYWIDLNTGLLVVSERLFREQTIYRMAALTLDPQLPESEDFTLPDGTVLCEVS